LITEATLKILIDKFPCSAGYKNLNSVFNYANVAYAEIVGLKHHSGVAGRTTYDMPARTAEYAALLHAQDNKVINSKKPLSVLGIHP